MAFFKENRRLLLQAFFSLLFIGLALFFIRHQRTEIHDVRVTLSNAHPTWILLGILLTCFFVFSQGLMYYNSFRCVGKKVSLKTTMKVYLKRHFISVFLPAGGVASLAFFTRDFKDENVSSTKIHFASSIYAFTGVLTIILISVPVLSWAILSENAATNQIVAFGIVCMMVVVLVIAAVSVFRQGVVFRIIARYFPGFESFLTELRAIAFNRKAYVTTVLTSLMIEAVGMVHIGIAMRAVGVPLSLEGAVMAYITSVLFLMISPFLRGLGAIELSVAFILTRFGYSTVDAISITLLFRLFEFWLVLAFGALSFIFVRNNIVLRIIPALLTFILGIVNIISVLTPEIPSRLNYVLEFLPFTAVHFSNYFVFTSGLFLLIISAFLLKGLKSSWYIAFFLALISLVGHLTKAIDYEEALLAGFVVVTLFMTRKQYFVKPHPEWGQIGIITAVVAMVGVFTYGTIGFFFLDKKYFNIDFTFAQSLKYCLENFFLFQSTDLQTTHRFGNDFLWSIKIAGFLSMSFLLYTMFRPLIYRSHTDETQQSVALGLVAKYGSSGIDYFKTCPDKHYFFGDDNEGFLSFRIAGTFAAVLGDPVCPTPGKQIAMVRGFDRFCLENGLKNFYYRVPEESLPAYESSGKKSLLIGQEAIIDLASFSLEGGARKSIRNACNKAQESGLFPRMYAPPVKDGILQKLKAVSDEWLEERHYYEMVFSQGMFNMKYLRQQTIITIENHEEKVLAFLNLIPDYAPGEMTYDLLRTARDAPAGISDFLVVETIRYLTSRGYKFFNMGFAPMSGIEKGRDFPEKSLKFAYEKIRSFSHFKGLRDFKEKYGPEWQNRYLIYEHHYDLFNIPFILTRVFKP
jgi:phosphatidylglycerol lysyltransferase